MNGVFAALEVMDKEPSLAVTVILAASLGVGGLLAGHRRPWLSLVPLAAFVAFGLARLSELEDRRKAPPQLRRGSVHVVRSVVTDSLHLDQRAPELTDEHRGS
jgi:hypothetical protein